jgi:hypothetical protein
MSMYTMYADGCIFCYLTDEDNKDEEDEHF